MSDNIVYKSLLYDYYGELLTEKQKDIIDMYYNNDLTISEISEQVGISRQGVYDALKRAENTLENYERKLGLVEKFLQQKSLLTKIRLILDQALASEIEDFEILKNRISEIREVIEWLLKV